MLQLENPGRYRRFKTYLPSREVVGRFLSGRRILILYAIVPVTVYGLVMWLFSVGYGMVMSTYDWNPMSIHRPTFVGLDNYRRAFATGLVWTALANSAKYAAFTTLLGTPLALAGALLLNSLRRGRGFFRLVFYLPVVTSMIATSIIWKALYQVRGGVFNAVLRLIRDSLGLGFALPRYLLNPRIALYCIGLMTIWKGLGFAIVIFMAGLSGIPTHYYDAARIDGAGRWALFRHVTFPLLQPTLVLVLITRIAGALQAFSEMYVMTGMSTASGGATMGGPVNSTLTIVLEIYQRAFRVFEFGYASALAVIVFVIITTISAIQLRIGRTRWEY